MKITFFGSGYVGLVAAAGFADLGHDVLCVDILPERVLALSDGKVPFFEPGLSEVMLRGMRGKRLRFSTDVPAEYRKSDIYFIAVGTPPGPDGAADVSAVHVVAKTVAEIAEKTAVVAVKSTVPLGTCDAVEKTLREATELEHSVASVPEFLKEGTALQDFFRPDRVILGCNDEHAEAALRELYLPLQLVSERILVMDRRSSELSKYAANAMLATRVSFMNEIAQVCDKLGANVHAIRQALGTDRRIGPQFLYAGPGYGGSCFPKDVSALASFADKAGVSLEVVKATQRANDNQRQYVLKRALEMLGEELEGKTVAVWGLAFKAETDDVRDTPVGPLVKGLMERGVRIQAHDPVAADNFRKYVAADAEYFASEYDAAKDADLLVLMTEWRHLRNPDFGRLKGLMRRPIVLDARNLWSRASVGDKGFTYSGIGTKAIQGS